MHDERRHLEFHAARLPASNGQDQAGGAGTVRVEATVDTVKYVFGPAPPVVLVSERSAAWSSGSASGVTASWSFASGRNESASASNAVSAPAEPPARDASFGEALPPAPCARVGGRPPSVHSSAARTGRKRARRIRPRSKARDRDARVTMGRLLREIECRSRHVTFLW